ncbi:hypothetical protein PoB_002949700 [Plakobranchus ocellatus]|uniref:Uncharacterized protein n=1 Tax=Plakobranchus ocellatus TaxID=259542 RepID=A0AAV4A6T5_9GAST|nr:hypothetical protein PoB_002949700 [Plakobranchus ocellatus]
MHVGYVNDGVFTLAQLLFSLTVLCLSSEMDNNTNSGLKSVVGLCPGPVDLVGEQPDKKFGCSRFASHLTGCEKERYHFYKRHYNRVAKYQFHL